MIAVLSEVLQLPAQISVSHCRAHTEQRDEVSKHNNLADRAAMASGSSTFDTRINFWQRPQKQK